MSQEKIIDNDKKTIFGVGINDANYKATTYQVINGKSTLIWRCPYYVAWSGMFVRCYSKSYQSRRPSYLGCTVDSRWHRFSEFRVWMEHQDWEGKELDKDILVKGNKIYSPETCAFVDAMTNSFLLDCRTLMNKLPIGVTMSKNNNKFRAQCNNPFTGKRDHIGSFGTQEEAHTAWFSRKREHAYMLAALQKDKRVSGSLISRFAMQSETAEAPNG